MSELKEFWSQKEDEELLEAAKNLADFTGEAENVIRSEMARRGLPEEKMTQEQETPKRNKYLPDPDSSRHGTMRRNVNLGCGLSMLIVCVPLFIYSLFNSIGILRSWTQFDLFLAICIMAAPMLFIVLGIGAAYNVWRVWRG